MRTMLWIDRCLAAMGLVWALPVPGADVSFYGIAKLQQFLQTNASSVVALPSNAFGFASFVVPSASFAVTNATVQPGSGPIRTLLLETNSGDLLGYTNFFSSQSALDSAFSQTATYTVTMDTVHDGIKSGGLSFYLFPPIIAISYPPTPKLANFTNAQAIDTTRDFTLQWNSLSGSISSLVEIIVVDAAGIVITNSPPPGQPGGLDQNSTSFTLAAHSLPPGTNLTAHVLVANPGLPNTSSYAGAVGIPVLAKDTLFPLTTRPGPVRPRLTVLPPPAGQLRLTFSSEVLRSYQLEASADWGTWDPVLSTNGTGTSITLTVPANLAHRFYRVRVGQ